MKKLLCLILVLLCAVTLTACCRHVWNEATCETPKTCSECGETEGEALGHSWQDATCETPKTCVTCALTEGEALGHNWQDATTEAPKTCTNCAATEGDRIITDPRFTTAATKDIQGTWVTELHLTGDSMDLADFDTDLVLTVWTSFYQDGTLEFYAEIANSDAYLQSLLEYMINTMYAQMAENGMDQTAADEAFRTTYGMDIPQYAEAAIGVINLQAIADAMCSTAVYYVADGLLYTGFTWEDEMVGETFAVSGDTITMDHDFFGLNDEHTTLTRVTE